MEKLDENGVLLKINLFRGSNMYAKIEEVEDGYLVKQSPDFTTSWLSDSVHRKLLRTEGNGYNTFVTADLGRLFWVDGVMVDATKLHLRTDHGIDGAFRSNRNGVIGNGVVVDYLSYFSAYIKTNEIKDSSKHITYELDIKDRLIRDRSGCHIIEREGAFVRYVEHRVDIEHTYKYTVDNLTGFMHCFIDVPSSDDLNATHSAKNNVRCLKELVDIRKYAGGNLIGHHVQLYYLIQLFIHTTQIGEISSSITVDERNVLIDKLDNIGAFKRWPELSPHARIAGVANQMYDGTVICGGRHGDHVMNKQMDLFFASKPKCTELNTHVGQGFIDQWGNFLDRRQAFKIALFQDQIKFRCGGDNEELYSENLH